MSGTLLLIATPVGNLSDISPRVKASLEKCDVLLVEDTRISIKLLNHLGIKKRMVSCHNFNEAKSVAMLAKANEAGQTVALLSDAGTPLISDPGFQIVKEAIALNMQVTPIPGPSAFILGLIGSGLPCHRFAFEGFLPDKIALLKTKLTQLRNEERTIIFYVAPHKLKKTLLVIKEILGERSACIARELTKLHEQFLRGNVSALLELISTAQVLGECVLVVAGRDDQRDVSLQEVSDESINLAIKKMLSGGLGVKEISSQCSKQFGLKRSQAYKQVLDYINRQRGVNLKI